MALCVICGQYIELSTKFKDWYSWDGLPWSYDPEYHYHTPEIECEECEECDK